jgi:hypothetical protein
MAAIGKMVMPLNGTPPVPVRPPMLSGSHVEKRGGSRVVAMVADSNSVRVGDLEKIARAFSRSQVVASQSLTTNSKPGSLK